MVVGPGERAARLLWSLAHHDGERVECGVPPPFASGRMAGGIRTAAPHRSHDARAANDVEVSYFSSTGAAVAATTATKREKRKISRLHRPSPSATTMDAGANDFEA